MHKVIAEVTVNILNPVIKFNAITLMSSMHKHLLSKNMRFDNRSIE